MSRKDGTHLDVSSTHLTIMEAGVVAGGVPIVRDVTAQKRAEEASLAKSEFPICTGVVRDGAKAGPVW
ncbi:MAG: hypothetical protein ACLQGV_13945 [Bryobacteraceae bacterium]